MVISSGKLGVSDDGWVPACSQIVEGWYACVTGFFFDRVVVRLRIEQCAGRPRHQVATCLRSISKVNDYRLATGNPLAAHAVMPPWIFT